MKLPSEKQCLEWFKEFKVPQNILQHCLKVRDKSLCLGKTFLEKGFIMDLDLIGRLALLHDMFKMATVNLKKHNKYHTHQFSEDELLAREEIIKKYPQMHEGEIAYSFLVEDYPELALAVKRSSSLTDKKESWEEIIVHYVDWRVLQSQLVTIPERIVYLEHTYNPQGEIWEEHKRDIFELERKIIKALALSSEEMFLR